MPDEMRPKLRLEIGHVLFLDIGIYSKLLKMPSLHKIGKAPNQLAKIKFKVTLPPQ